MLWCSSDRKILRLLGIPSSVLPPSAHFHNLSPLTSSGSRTHHTSHDMDRPSSRASVPQLRAASASPRRASLELKKQVRFNDEQADVRHIPSVEELRSEGILHEIWYSSWDFNVFKSDATSELYEFMRLHGLRKPVEGLLYLYQPASIIESIHQRRASL